jgi:hypothetical protein
MALPLACGTTSPSPTSPTTAAGIGASGAFGPGNSTLKVSAPAPISPVDDVEVEGYKPEMTAANSTGQYVAATGLQYRFQLYDPDDNTVFEAVVAGGDGQTAAAPETDLDADKQFRWRVRAELGGRFGPWSTMAAFRTRKMVGPVAFGTGPRTPDPAPGTRLPLPNMSHIVREVAGTHADLLRHSCQEHGGSWDFMDAVVDRLRQFDSRWGYNWKRGNVGDPSMDVVDYHWGAGPDEGSTQVYIIDIIGGHCGPSPVPVWNDVTQITYEGNTVGRWTSRGRF